ncbi:protein FAR1-RELATED SEQUENCE 5-like [Nicotiana tabacum]|uniref:Protein FAR1-RELATED SEQUENCE 5-like n=1 Tax=Nicotiana tabacum TaxID=4097 RepID=A0AC58TGZ5_TOBAC
MTDVHAVLKKKSKIIDMEDVHAADKINFTQLRLTFVSRNSIRLYHNDVNIQGGSTLVHNVININDDFAFKIGRKFCSENESYEAYNSYAVAKGFGVRKGQSPLCSDYQEKKRQRLEYRCGCMARIKFKISNGVWEVFEFFDEHNHLMVKENLRHFISSGRRLTDATKDILSSMVDASIRTKKAVRYLQNEAGGIENAGFIEQDAHNFIQARKRSMINCGDAQTLLNHFMHLQSEDSNFFYSFQVDEDGSMCNFFLER